MVDLIFNLLLLLGVPWLVAPTCPKFGGRGYGRGNKRTADTDGTVENAVMNGPRPGSM